MHRSVKIKAALFLLFMLFIAAIYLFTPLKDNLHKDAVLTLFNSVKAHPFSYPLFILVCAIAVALMFPSFIFVIAAGLLFGPLKGSIASIIGVNAGALLAFASGRTFLHDFVAHHVHRFTLVKRLNEHAERNGLLYVATARMVMVIPWNVFNYAVSLSKVRSRDYALGSFLGMLPEILIYCIFGSSLIKAFQDEPAGLLLPGLLVLAMIGLALVLRKKLLYNKEGIPPGAEKDRKQP